MTEFFFRYWLPILLVTTAGSLLHSVWLLVKYKTTKTLSLFLLVVMTAVLTVSALQASYDNNRLLCSFASYLTLFTLVHLVVAFWYYMHPKNFFAGQSLEKKLGTKHCAGMFMVASLIYFLLLRDPLIHIRDGYEEQVDQTILVWSWIGPIVFLIALGWQTFKLFQAYRDKRPMTEGEQGTGAVSLLKLYNAQLVTISFAAQAMFDWAWVTISVNAVSFMANSVSIYLFHQIKKRESRGLFS